MKKAFEERFWNKVNKSTPEKCWEWKAGFRKEGYGWIGGFRGRSMVAHRAIMLHLHEKPIDYEPLVLHKCNNRKCVNPAHLYFGSYKDNAHDMLKAGTCYLKNKIHPVGEDHKSSVLTNKQAQQILDKKMLGLSITEISKDMGLNVHTVSNVFSGTRFKFLKTTKIKDLPKDVRRKMTIGKKRRANLIKHQKLINTKIHRLTILNLFYKENVRKCIATCLCDCGNVKDIALHALLSGNTQSCCRMRRK